MHLHTLWFVIIAFFWIGFFVLEGFDFGVGALHMITGKTDTERRVALNAIGPWWDGNEVWLVVAGASMFAAFPGWYATMFSALYLALLLVLAALMARGVSFEYRGKRDDPRWRTRWSWCATTGSVLIPFLLGLGLGDLLVGLPINSKHDFTGNFFDLLTPYGIWTGLTLVGLCLLHGATFLMLKTAGVVRDRARALVTPLGCAASALVIGFVIWTRAVHGHTQVPGPVEVLAVISVIFGARLASGASHDGWAFAATAVAIASTVGSIFIDLSPDVMVSSTSAAYNLTISGVAASSYSLKVMTVVAILFVPLVLLYQGWSFHVFRERVSAPEERQASAEGAAALDRPDGTQTPPAAPAGAP